MKPVLLTLTILLLAAAAAQSTPLPPNAFPAPNQTAGSIAGVWQTTIPLGPGIPSATGVLMARPDGTYREELLVDRQITAFWEGTYTLTPDGVFTQNETAKSPQICAMGECFPNDGPPTTVSHVSMQGPNAMVVSVQDPASGQTVTLAWQRVDAQGAVPGQAQAQVPTPPPAAAGANPWIGSFTDGDLTLHVGGAQGDVLERRGVSYPLTLRDAGGRLEGTFSAAGTSYPVVIERVGQNLMVSTGGARYDLAPLAGGGAAIPANPLGN